MVDSLRPNGATSEVLVIYAYTGRANAVPADVRFAIAELRLFAAQLVVIVPPSTPQRARAELALAADQLVDAQTDSFLPSWYSRALAVIRMRLETAQQVVLTGDSWLGPLGSFETASHRVSGEADVWQMIENETGTRSAYTIDGAEQEPRPFLWVQARAELLIDAESAAHWVAALETPSSQAEWALNKRFNDVGYRTDYAFAAHDFPTLDPGLLSAELLMEAGCPIVAKAVFQSYPPALDRQGVIGREIALAIEGAGYPADLLWESLARTTAPKTMNTNAGMLEVVDDHVDTYDLSAPYRIAVLARVTDLELIDELLSRIGYLPGTFDAYFTVKDGMSAAIVQRRLDAWWADRDGLFEVRVTPMNKGRDMSDLFVACRDVLAPGRYELVVKLHARDARNKTVNLARYFNRYQFENLLAGPVHARNVIAMFQRERGLGLVFPPMMHVGYATMGSGWAGVESYARGLCDRVGIHVPLDHVSPLSPDGRMWVARPEALILLSERRWSFADYARSDRSWHGHLAQIQERLIVPAAAELGYHSRTVLTPEHAGIGHTALDFKVDELFSTTRGYPVEQIQLLHRAGYTGYGGPVAIARMYINLNHRVLAHTLRPIYQLLFRAFVGIAPIRRTLTRLRRRRNS